MQAYQTRALDLIGHVTAIARKYKLRLMCRLVKGAYWDSEIKRAQEMGLPHYPVFTHKHHTDVSYLACAQALLAAPDVIYPQFAGHNAATIAAIVQMASRNAVPKLELQRLHGMGEGVFREVLKNPLISCRVYAPVGAHRDLLAYLVRRLLENGANSSFVHQLADESVGMGELLTSPLRLEPDASLPLPPALYGADRANSLGLDLTVESMRAPLLAALAATPVPVVPEFDAARASDREDRCQRLSSVEQGAGRRTRRHLAPRRRCDGAADAEVLRAAGERSLQDLGRRRLGSARGGGLPALLRQ
jgi:RHH-type proline utilization regulon transcriptional repressor/proline dehydrogenase/delta 1-pyrroline-5-carboxylate dehydrogenase